MRRLAIIYNPKSGSSSIDKGDIEALFKDLRVAADYFSIKTGLNDLKKQLETQKYDALVAAGGDGTVNASASLAVQFDITLGVLPAGTLNHFAKDLAIPLDLQAAANTLANGATKRVDYCTVNGNIFVNNSSIGIYPSTVTKREHLQTKIGKWPAAFVVSLKALFQTSATHLNIKTPSGTFRFKTPLLFIGNNSYRFKKRGFNNRATLNSGKLFLYVIRANRATAIIGIVLRAFFGRRTKQRDFMQHTPGPITVESRKRVMNVAADGEVIALRPPLTYVMHAGSIRVLVPAKAASSVKH